METCIVQTGICIVPRKTPTSNQLPVWDRGLYVATAICSLQNGKIRSHQFAK